MQNFKIDSAFPNYSYNVISLNVIRLSESVLQISDTNEQDYIITKKQKTYDKSFESGNKSIRTLLLVKAGSNKKCGNY